MPFSFLSDSTFRIKMTRIVVNLNLRLRNLHSFLLKRLVSKSTAPTSSFKVDYLVNSCGLPLDSALSVSKKLKIDKNQIPQLNSVLRFLKSYGFDDTQVAELVTKRPGLLLYKVHDNLKLKFDLLIENGFVGHYLPRIILINPVVLTRNLDSHIKPSFEFLKKFLTTNDILKAARRSSWLLNMDSKGMIQPNVEILQRGCVPVDVITKMLIVQPRTIMQNVDRVAYAVKFITSLGIDPAAPLFIPALKSMLYMKESTWKMKFDLFKSFGWSEDDVLSVFKRQPFCLACSEGKLETLMNFYLNTWKVEPKIIIGNPTLLMHGFEKRVRPRYNVLKILASKELVKWDKKLHVIKVGEKRFMEKYVLKNLNEVPDLLEIYQTSMEDTVVFP